MDKRVDFANMVVVIGIAGGSGSGKTTTAEILLKKVMKQFLLARE